MATATSAALLSSRSLQRKRARAMLVSLFALEQFEQRLALSVSYSIAPGGTLDIFPLSQIIPAGMDRIEVRLNSVPGTSYGSLIRMSGVTEIPWGSSAPNVFKPGDGNNRINGGEGLRYVASPSADGQVEVIPIRFRNGTGFTSQDETISISINSHLNPPVITQQPNTFIQIGVGATATMSVAATGTSAPTYQWYSGIAPNASNPIAGATSSSYTTPSLSTVQQYNYWCRVRNADGVANSDTVTVQVATPTTTTTSNVSAAYTASAQTVNVSANVSPANNIGAVTFQIVSFGVYQQVSVVNGVANATLAIPAGASAGSYAITAEYAAPAGIAGSIDTKTLTITPATTTIQTSANLSGTASTSGQTVNLSANVSSAAGAINQGTITFGLVDAQSNFIGSPVTSGTVSNGTASVSYALPPNARAGSYTIRAVYNGTGNLSSSTDTSKTFTQAPLVAANSSAIASNATSVTIFGSGFSTTPGDNVVTFAPGASGTVTSATATQLTYTFTTPPPSGVLKASVTTRGVSSAVAVQVATVDLPPDLSVAVSHQNDFVAGSNKNVYRISVSGAVGQTASEVVLTGTLPAGMTATSLSGSGWTITQGTGNSVIARRSDTLAAGSAYPVLALAVSVAAGQSAAVTPTFVITGGGDVTPANNTASDSTVLTETPSLVVNTTADTANSSDNQTSLREAVAYAQRSTAVVGFDGWSINRGSSSGTSPFVTAGTLPLNDSLLLTAAENSQANSAWSGQRVNVNSFSASFTYTQNAGANGADGFAFAFQNAGAQATGGGGGGLGVSGVAGAAGIAFDIYGPAGVGFKSFVNGTLSGSFTALGNGVSLTNGSPIQFTISGNGTALTLTATQGSNSFTTSLPLDVAASVGGNVAYVGFTGGTGGATAQQTISKFSFSSAAAPSTVSFAPALAGQTVVLSQAWGNATDDESRSALVINSDVTLAGPATGAGVTLSIASGVQKRHLLVNSSGTLTVSNLTFTNGYGNIYGGAIWSYGSLIVRNSTFTNNYAGTEGGAIQTWGGSPLFRLENSTIAGNTSGNYASALGIGSTNSSIDSATIVDNTSPNANGTIWIYQTLLTMRNSIVASNLNDGTAINGTGAFSAASTNNIVGVGDWTGLNAASANRINVPSADLRLGTLADNGGSTATVALLPGSPAINAGMPIAGINTDQRGTVRTQGSAPDIGAYERLGTAATIGSVAMEYDARLAATFNFNLDASVTFSRSQIQIQNLTTNTAVGGDVGAFDFDATGTHATLTLNNQLPDGNYRITIPGTSPTDFFVLRGDLNRDRVVNFADLVTLAQNYNKTSRTLSTGDTNYDGVVNFNDLVALAQNYNRTLLAAAPALVSSTIGDLRSGGTSTTKKPTLTPARDVLA